MYYTEGENAQTGSVPISDPAAASGCGPNVDRRLHGLYIQPPTPLTPPVSGVNAGRTCPTMNPDQATNTCPRLKNITLSYGGKQPPPKVMLWSWFADDDSARSRIVLLALGSLP